MQLPVELRELIYFWYFQCWSAERIIPRGIPRQHTIPIPPYEPPLTRISRLVREESIPIFYKTYRFPLVLHGYGHGSVLRPRNNSDWYDRLRPECLSMIRHIELFICRRGISGARFEAAIFHIDFSLTVLEVELVLPTAIDLYQCAADVERQGMYELINKVRARADTTARLLAARNTMTSGGLYGLAPLA